MPPPHALPSSPRSLAPLPLQLEGKTGWFFTEAIYLVNTFVTWPLFRLYIFPNFVIRTVFIGYQELCLGAGGTATGVSTTNVLEVPFWITIRTAMLSALFVLHIFWWGILVRIGVKLVMGQKAQGAADDVYEGEDNERKKKQM